MKKIGVLCGLMMVSSSALAALNCAYTEPQRIVRDAEIVLDIMDLPESVDVNASYACGGNLLQLATLRGNPDNMQYLLDRGANPNVNVSLAGYEIEGAPAVIPFALFAARYSPTSAIIDMLVEYDTDFHVVDVAGHDVFWYFEQNPVLRNSYLTKKGFNGGLVRFAERVAAARMAQQEAEEAAAKEKAAAPAKK